MHFHVVVQTVGVDVFDDALVFHLGLGYIGNVYAGRIALELDVEPELVFLHCRRQIVHVLHHEVPVGLLGVVAGVLERLHEEALAHIGHIAGKLAHLVGHAAVGILIGHGQHLVGLQGLVKGDIAKGGVDGVFRRLKEACALQFLIVHTSHEGGIEHGRCFLDIAGLVVGGGELLVETVGIVGGRHGAVALAQVGQRHDVAGVVGGSTLVGHPYLYTVYLDAGGQVGQRLHGIVVHVAEVVGEEEVSVLLIVGGINLEGGELHAALRGDTLRR